MLKGRRRKRDDIDVLRVMLWYTYIEQNLSQTVHYQIEKIIEPNAFGKNAYGDPYHHNKWSGYKVGAHTPNPPLIDAAGVHVPGSPQIVNSVLWEAIRGKKQLDWFLKTGIPLLSWEVKRVLYKSKHSHELISTLSRKELRSLELLAGLDALAAQIIFLRIADSQNERNTALNIGEAIYRTFLILCTQSPFSNHCIELIKLLSSYVFPLAHNNYKGIYIRDDLDILFEIRILNELAHESNVENQASRKQEVRTMLDLLYGKKGYDIKFGLAAPIAILSELNKLDFWEQKSKAWGLDVLRNGRVERLPPLSTLLRDGSGNLNNSYK